MASSKASQSIVVGSISLRRITSHLLLNRRPGDPVNDSFGAAHAGCNQAGAALILPVIKPPNIGMPPIQVEEILQPTGVSPANGVLGHMMAAPANPVPDATNSIVGARKPKVQEHE